MGNLPSLQTVIVMSKDKNHTPVKTETPAGRRGEWVLQCPITSLLGMHLVTLLASSALTASLPSVVNQVSQPPRCWRSLSAICVTKP